MFRCFLTCALLFMLVAGFSSSLAASDQDVVDFSANGRKWQPAPSGHTPGKDNGAGSGLHNAGEDCGACHRPNGKAAKQVFSMSGTLYEDRTARIPLKGGEVILDDVSGNVISMTSNEAGNFWTYTPIAGNPMAVVSYGGKTQPLYSTDSDGKTKPAPVDDARTWQYKTWVKNGDQVIPMVTIAPVGAFNDSASRMSCNMHHARLGNRGGLWVSRISTLPSYPSSDLSFKKHILPIFRNKCAPCHIPGETWTRIVTKTDYQGASKIDFSGGLDLTSYGGSNVTANDVAWKKKGIVNAGLVSPAKVQDSMLLLKTMKDGFTHAGGWFWTTEDPDYKAISQWIKEGARDN